MSKPKLDVYWLIDATGSMGEAVNNLKTSISDSWDALGYRYDIGQGAGFYRDMGVSGEEGYGVLTPIVTDPNQLQTAINKLTAKGGGPTPESQVYALTQIGRFGNTIRWREGAIRVIAWAGDYYGHKNQFVNGEVYTTAGAVKALQGSRILVNAFSLNPADKLNDSGGGAYVAASEIVPPTGGLIREGVPQEAVVQHVISTILAMPAKLEGAAGFFDAINAISEK